MQPLCIPCARFASAWCESDDGARVRDLVPRRHRPTAPSQPRTLCIKSEDGGCGGAGPVHLFLSQGRTPDTHTHTHKRDTPAGRTAYTAFRSAAWTQRHTNGALAQQGYVSVRLDTLRQPLSTGRWSAPESRGRWSAPASAAWRSLCPSATLAQAANDRHIYFERVVGRRALRRREGRPLECA